MIKQNFLQKKSEMKKAHKTWNFWAHGIFFRFQNDEISGKNLKNRNSHDFSVFLIKFSFKDFFCSQPLSLFPRTYQYFLLNVLAKLPHSIFTLHPNDLLNRNSLIYCRTSTQKINWWFSLYSSFYACKRIMLIFCCFSHYILLYNVIYHW